jgi:signal peptidase II
MIVSADKEFDSGGEKENTQNSSSHTTPLKKAYGSVAAWARFLIPAVVGLVLDLWVKAYSFPNPWERTPEGMRYAGRNPAMYGNETIPIIPHVLGFTTTVNGGAVFGSFQGHVPVFLGFSIIALAVILWVFCTSGAKHRVVHLALGLITAGALGNLYDRARFEGVRDMLRFYVDWYPYIFNVADVLLCIGVPLLIVRWMFVPDENPSKPAMGNPSTLPPQA